MKIAAEVGFAPPVVVTATAISTCGKGAEALLGMNHYFCFLSFPHHYHSFP